MTPSATRLPDSESAEASPGLVNIIIVIIIVLIPRTGCITSFSNIFRSRRFNRAEEVKDAQGEDGNFDSSQGPGLLIR